MLKKWWLMNILYDRRGEKKGKGVYVSNGIVGSMKEKQKVQLVPPAMAGRQQRITDFKEYVEANRKDMSSKQILATYSLETGISVRTLRQYLGVLIDAGVYVKPSWSLTKGKLVTPAEHKRLLQATR